MTVAIWNPGRRLFSSAAILMVLMAVAHTAGFLSGGPSSPVEEKLFADMGALRSPLGLGMSPSVKDIYFALAFTLSISFAALGLMNLILAAIPETPVVGLFGPCPSAFALDNGSGFAYGTIGECAGSGGSSGFYSASASSGASW